MEREVQLEAEIHSFACPRYDQTSPAWREYPCTCKAIAERAQLGYERMRLADIAERVRYPR